MTFKAYARGLGQRLAAQAGSSLCFALACLPAHSQSQSPQAVNPLKQSAVCPVKPFYPLPADLTSLQTLQAQLGVMASVCLYDASFYAWRGALLLAQHQPSAAIEALERALLLDPHLPGVQLDYAEALLLVGDTASARNLLEQISMRPDLPAYLRPLLAHELASANPDAWRSRWLVTTALGLDSNLNNAPAASELTLTFPQGPVTLPLLESARPQSGAAALNIVQWQGLKLDGEQLWLLQAELRARHTAKAATRYQQTDFSANWLQAPEAPRQWIVRSGLTRVDFGGQQLLQSARASLMRQWQAPASMPLFLACRPSAGLELESRRYPVSPELNGRYGGLVGALNCMAPDKPDAAVIFSHQLLGVQLRLGSDQANSANRPGSNYSRAELRVTWEGRYGSSRLNADYGYTRQLDASGYSPLLSGNLARQASRHSLRAEIARPLPPQWLGGADGFLSIETSQQASNLAVFESRQSAVYAWLRWRIP